MTETSMRRSARLCSETLVVTRRDYIPNCSEIRSSFGPPPVRARSGPGGRDDLRQMRRYVESAARSRPRSRWVLSRRPVTFRSPLTARAL